MSEYNYSGFIVRLIENKYTYIIYKRILENIFVDVRRSNYNNDAKNV